MASMCTQVRKGANSKNDYAYQTMVACRDKVTHGLSQEPQAMATALHSRGFISDQTLSEIIELSGTNRGKGEQLYFKVLGVVKEYPGCYGEFVEILQANEVLYSKLLQSLQEVSTRIQEGTYTLQQGSYGNNDDLPQPVAEYAAFLKEFYCSQSVIQDDPWPPSLGQQYINLSLINHDKNPQVSVETKVDLLRGNIDKIEGSKEPIKYEDVFNSNEKFRILIDGAPGVGKTTLCRKICQDWAQGKILTKYQLLVNIPLRAKKQLASVSDFVYHDNPAIKEAVVEYIQTRQGAGVMFIFDGYDEIHKRKMTNDSVFRIFKGEQLRHCSTVITSRPYASERLQRVSSLSRHVEILGFSQFEIEECIEANIKNKEKAVLLIEKLTSRQDLLHLCYIPLNCAIVIYIYDRQGYTIPATLSELFEQFIRNSLERQRDIFATSLKMLNKLLMDLSSIAYEKFFADELTFEEDEIPSSEEARLGLLTATKSFSGFGLEIVYQFIHLTIQEYLTAKWISTLSEERQAEIMREHLLNVRYRLVFIFLAGITKLDNDYYRDTLSSQQLILYDAHQELQKLHTLHPEQNCDVQHFEFLVHLAYESTNHKTCNALAKSVVDKTFSIEGQYHQGAHYMEQMGYFIAQSGLQWESVSVGFRGDEQLAAFLKQLHNAKHETKIKRLQLFFARWENKVYPILNTLWEVLKIDVFSSLLCLEASAEYTCSEQMVLNKNFNKSDPKTIACKNTLQSACISYSTSNLTIKDNGQLLISFLGYCENLKHLTFDHGRSYTKYLDSSILKSILTETKASRLCIREGIQTSLKQYAYAYNYSNIAEFRHILGQFLLQSIDIQSLTFLLQDSIAPACIKWTSSLQHSIMNKSNLILQALSSNNGKLKFLNIDSVFLMSSVPNKLADTVRVNKTLHTLIINMTSISINPIHDKKDFIEQLAEGLYFNTTLERVCLLAYIDPANFYKLFCIMRKQNNLKVLQIDACLCNRDVDDTTTTSIARMLLQNTSLTTVMIIVFPKISEQQVRRIARCLVLNGRRTHIELSFETGRDLISDYPSTDLINDVQSEVIQAEVDTFKETMISTMLKVMLFIHTKNRTTK